MNKIVSTGNRGKEVRSDCYVEFEHTTSGGRNITLQSKVAALYGNAIKKLINQLLDHFDIVNAKVFVEDSGALDFVITARLEAAIKKSVETDKNYLLPIIEENRIPFAKDSFRFSRLYLPGNSPKLMLNAGIHHPNGVILDLEDSVAPSRKFEATLLVRNALRSVNFYGAEKMVRINQGARGLEDLHHIIPHQVDHILIPKCESAEDIRQVNETISQIREKENIKRPVWLMPIIESAKGVLNAQQIATAADNVAALAIGLEDYTADIGTRRTDEGRESFFARSMVVNAARAAGIQPIDSVFSDVTDMEALTKTVQESKALGFDGMGCIHPRQIEVIHENFAPEKEEIEKAKKIVLAFREAEAKGLGVVSLGSKMIDPPVVKRAQKTIQMAIETGKLTSDWDKDQQ